MHTLLLVAVIAMPFHAGTLPCCHRMVAHRLAHCHHPLHRSRTPRRRTTRRRRNSTDLRPCTCTAVVVASVVVAVVAVLTAVHHRVATRRRNVALVLSSQPLHVALHVCSCVGSSTCRRLRHTHLPYHPRRPTHMSPKRHPQLCSRHVATVPVLPYTVSVSQK